MPEITIVTRDGTSRRVAARPGLSLMEAIRGADIDEMLALCGGTRSCATCHVVLAADDYARAETCSPMTIDEGYLLDSSSYRKPTSRLACQVTIADDLAGLTATIAPED